MTIRTLLERAVSAHPRRAALRFRRGGNWQTRGYAELAEGVRQMAEAFGRLGLKPGADRAAIILENGPEWVEAYLALAGTGVQVVPIDPKLRPEEVGYVLGDSGAALVLTDESHRGLLEAVLPALPAVRTVVMSDGKGGPPPVAGRDCRGYEQLRAEAAGGPLAWYDAHRPAPQDVASIIYTSGTTGRPKGAMLTHHNFCSDVAGALEAIGPGEVTSSDDFFVVLPLFHSFSFTANFVLALYCGGGLCFAESVRSIGSDIKTLRPTVFMAVPLLVEKLINKIEAGIQGNTLARFLLGAGLGRLVGWKVRQSLGGRLRFLVVGGAPCPVHLLKGFGRLGITVIEGYGLTECSPVVSLNNLRAPRVGTIGRKIANIEVRIAEPDAQGVGELQVRGPVVMKGYFGDVEATREAFDGEWLRTGDLASIDGEGYLTIRGRKKALIVNREGKNIYPEEVESVIARDPLVADVIVLGYTVGGVPGERVGAIVAPNPDAVRQLCGGEEPAWVQVERLVGEAVRRQCESLAEYKHPRKIAVCREPLERTSVQKVRRCAYQGKLNE